jgi:hypothetical protein
MFDSFVVRERGDDLCARRWNSSGVVAISTDRGADLFPEKRNGEGRE